MCRLIDVNEGEIRIDGVDTSSIGIDVLRKQLAVIPQDPVLFGGEGESFMSLPASHCDAGTLRSNLDPWSEHSDARVWYVLQNVCLDAVVRDIGGLEALISENGGNLSVGQRQLLCLARWPLSVCLRSFPLIAFPRQGPPLGCQDRGAGRGHSECGQRH